MEKLLLGTVLKPQGIKGELKLSAALSENMIKDIQNVYLDNSENATGVEHLVFRFGFYYLQLSGIDDRDKSETLRGCNVYILKQDTQLPENTFLIEDLIGSDVYNKEDKYLGIVTNVENYGATDVFTILEGKREYTVAFLSSIFIKIEDKKIIVDEQKYNEGKICE